MFISACAMPSYDSDVIQPTFTALIIFLQIVYV